MYNFFGQGYGYEYHSSHTLLYNAGPQTAAAQENRERGSSRAHAHACTQASGACVQVSWTCTASSCVGETCTRAKRCASATPTSCRQTKTSPSRHPRVSVGRADAHTEVLQAVAVLGSYSGHSILTCGLSVQCRQIHVTCSYMCICWPVGLLVCCVGLFASPPARPLACLITCPFDWFLVCSFIGWCVLFVQRHLKVT